MTSLLLHLILPADAVDLGVGPSQPYASIEAAVAAAETGDRVMVDPGTYDEREIDVVGLDLEVRAVAGPGTVVVRAIQGNGLFDIRSGARLTLAELEIDGLSSRRLAEVDDSALVVESCTVHDLEAPTNGRAGGAIQATNSALVIRSSTFRDGASPVKPGGLLGLTTTSAELIGSTFEAGTSRDGGAISAELGSSVVVDGCAFFGNDAQDGAAIHASASDLEVRGATFTGNVSANGVIRCLGGASCGVEGATFEGNTGAALLVDGVASSWLRGSVVCATTAPAAVDLRDTTAQVEGSVLLANLGAALRVDARSSAVLVNDHLVGNAGEALIVEGQASLVNALVAYNVAPGAAVSAASGALSADYNLYWDNGEADLDVAQGPNDVLADPLLTLLPGCDLAPLVPGPGSPAVDAGDPAVGDDDGTRSDIGAFGGGEAGPPVEWTDADADGWPRPNDCDDTDPAVHPGVKEVGCDGIDNDCRPETVDGPDADGDGVNACEDCLDTDPDRTVIVTVYRDDDFDGYGRGQPTEVCGTPLNAALVGGDCDDTDPGAHPGAVDIPYDGVDQDCDGADLSDLDGDGFDPPEDCDDQDPKRFPGNEERYDDGVDQDCTGSDASATLSGGSGVTCGCRGTPSPASGWLAVAALLISARSSAPRRTRRGG